ncbi:lachesin-like [Tubulanus polymorphus]|uniref:lachesin-like n=1 Tax=Tubulanus polymorphus TaxID=672921 RepID=UPI003DA53728
MMKYIVLLGPILAVLFLLTVTDGAERDQSVITKSIRGQIVHTGATAYLNCTVSNPFNYPVHWWRIIGPKNMVPLATNTGINIINYPVSNGKNKYEILLKRQSGRIKQYVLVIRSVQQEDAGKYRCQIAVPNVVDSPFKDGSLVVQRSPMIDTSLSSMGPIYANEGSNITLKCFAEGIPNPEISWTRVNGDLLPTGKYKEVGNYYTLTNITKEYRGVYRCNAENRVPPTSRVDIEVIVYFTPAAKAFRHEIGQMPDKNYKSIMDCVIKGFPEPDINWYKLTSGNDRVLITTDSKHSISETFPKGSSDLLEGDKWTSLVIMNVQSGDFGMYACEGKSPLGRNSAYIKLYGTTTCQGPLCQAFGREKQAGGAVVLTANLLVICSSTLLLLSRMFP